MCIIDWMTMCVCVCSSSWLFSGVIPVLSTRMSPHVVSVQEVGGQNQLPPARAAHARAEASQRPGLLWNGGPPAVLAQHVRVSRTAVQAAWQLPGAIN